jgi:copper chaperone NosL
VNAPISLSLGALLLALSACERMDRPVDPVWGKEPCAHCAMLVGDRRYAAEVVANGERRFFDDIGCYVLWSEERPNVVERAWVRDAEGNRWIDARSATYVHGARTPMDFGFEGRATGATNTTSSLGVTFEEMRTKVIARRDRERTAR